MTDLLVRRASADGARFLPTGPATLADAFALAVHPEHGKMRDPGSEQQDEWERAGREAVAAWGRTRRVRDLSAADGRLLVQSACLRMAAKATVETWEALLTDQRQRRVDPSALLDLMDLLLAYRSARGPLADIAPPPLSGRRWCEVVVHLVRAQLNYARKYEPDRFAGSERFAVVEAIPTLRSDIARRLDTTVKVTVNRARPELTEAGRIVRCIMDPRRRVYYVLSPACNTDGAYRVQRSHITFDATKLRYKIQKTKADGTVVPGYNYVEGKYAAYLETALASLYGALEAAWRSSGTDYALFSGHAWDGMTLVRDPDGRMIRMDPRLWLVLVLGMEGRLGQHYRPVYSMLQQVEDGSMCLRSVGVGTKDASDLPLCEAQVDALAFAVEYGHLAPLMEARDATLARLAAAAQAASEASGDADPAAAQLAPADETHVDAADTDTAGTTTDGSDTVTPSAQVPRLDVLDFPLVPATQLVGGQAVVARAMQLQVNERTLRDWLDPVLRTLGIKYEGVSLRCFRRLFVDLYKEWGLDEAVHMLITGHDAVKATGASGAETLNNVYYDSRQKPKLTAARAVMQYMRTEFAATDAPYRADPTA